MSSLNVKSTILIGATTVATAALSVWLCKSLSQYGLEGTVRYIWEGDPYPPEIRDTRTRLEKVERAIQEECILDRLEESLARARLDSVDEVTIIEPQWIIAHAPYDLEKDLAKVSHDLDTFAANVDAVPSHGDAELKMRKKKCSERVVTMMARADFMLALYKQDDVVK